MAFNIPHFSVTLQPRPGQTGYWKNYSTPATDPSPDSNSDLFGTPACVLSGANAVVKSWEWWMCVSLLVPAAYSGAQNAIFGNAHNTPWEPTVFTWAWGDGVSAVSFVYKASTGAILFKQQPNFPNHELTLVPVAVKGQRYDFLVQLILGRLDQQLGLAGPGVNGGGIGNHPNNGAGRARVWVNGSDTPKDSGDVNNLQRRTHATDGKTYTQTTLYRNWDGWYIIDNSRVVTAELYASRLGRSVAEALADGSGGFSQYSDVFTAGSSAALLTPLSSDDFLVPASFGGVPAPPPPGPGGNQTGPWGDVLQWNSVTAEPPTAIEQMTGPWGAPIQWDSTAAPVGVGAGGRFFKRFFGPAQLSSAVYDLYTVPSGKRAVIRHIHVSNPGVPFDPAQSVDFTFSIGTDAAATRLWDGYPIASDDLLQHFRDHTLVAGEKIQAYANFSNVLNLTVEGYEESLEPQTGTRAYGDGTYGDGTYGGN